MKGDSASDITGKFPVYEEEDSSVYSPRVEQRQLDSPEARVPLPVSAAHIRGQSRDLSPTKRGKGTVVERQQYEEMRKKWGQKDGDSAPPTPPMKDGDSRKGGPPAYI